MSVQPPQTKYANGKRRESGRISGPRRRPTGPRLSDSGSMSNVDVRWEHTASARFLERLASFSRLVIFDRRGVGVSDRLPPEVNLTWEEWAEDLQVVLDAVDSRRAVLFAVADGGAMAITFAASHPDRIEARYPFTHWGTTAHNPKTNEQPSRSWSPASKRSSGAPHGSCSSWSRVSKPIQSKVPGWPSTCGRP